MSELYEDKNDFWLQSASDSLSDKELWELQNQARNGLTGVEATRQFVIEDAQERISRLEDAGFQRSGAFGRVTEGWPDDALGVLAFHELSDYNGDDGYSLHSRAMREVAEKTNQL